MEKRIYADRNFSEEHMLKIAKDIGLNTNKLKSDMEGPCKERIQKDQQDLARVGVRGTPAFYINGRFLSGNRPIEQFKAVIDEELKKANDRIAKGTPVEKYYDEFVLKKGQKQFKAN